MIAQLGIALFGVTAIWYSQSKNMALHKWASVFGLAGQPFWLWSSISAGQWGIVFLCALYTAAWAKGFWHHWQPEIEAFLFGRQGD
jgi:hypothetical protein